MLQDPRPIKPLQRALCSLLEEMGLEFLPSQWELQTDLADSEHDTDLNQLLAYLTAEIALRKHRESISRFPTY